MSQKKLVESFKAFFQKSVAPYVSQNPQVMREWSHLSKIISSDPIDYSQIEFYLLLSNKNNPPSTPISIRTSQHIIDLPNKTAETDRVRYNNYNSANDKNNDRGNFEKKNSLPVTSGSKKKNLINSLQNFQKVLIYNQERLQNISKKQTTWGGNQGGLNIIPNVPIMRKY